MNTAVHFMALRMILSRCCGKLLIRDSNMLSRLLRNASGESLRDADGKI